MKKEKKTNLFSLKKIDTYSFVEGLELATSFSVLIYLCNFLLPNTDIRISIVFVSIILIVPFVIKLLLYFFFRKMERIFFYFKNNYFLLLIPSYFLIIVIPENYQFISITLIITSKVLLGFIFSAFNSILIVNFNKQSEFNNDSVFKYFCFFLLGIVLGSLIFSLTNAMLSNAELNQWGWKIPYFFILAYLCIIFLSSKEHQIQNLEEYNYFLSNLSLLKSSFKAQVQNIYIIIPLFYLILYCSSNWLPKFSNPENMQFLSIDTVFFVLTFLSTLFIYPLLKLIGKLRATFFICCFLFVISIIMSFFTADSNYSVDFLKFYMSIASGLTLCIFLLDFGLRSGGDRHNLFFAINLPNIIISIMVPLSFYYFIHSSISYNIIYIAFALIYLVCLLSRMNPRG